MTAPSKQHNTTLLTRVEQHDAPALEALYHVVYEDLKGLARRLFVAQRGDHLLQPTALVHEAYLRLIDQQGLTWKSRAHFFAVGARAMRQILIDHARAQATDKRGGGWKQVSLDASAQVQNEQLLALNQALVQFSEQHERKAQVVELRYFAGLSIEETACVLGVTVSTVGEDWRFARAWLSKQISEEVDP